MKATTAIDRADEAMLDEANNLLKSIASTESVSAAVVALLSQHDSFRTLKLSIVLGWHS